MGIFGWSYPPGAASDPFAPYNQQEELTNEDCEKAFADYESPYALYRAAYKYTDCGPSIGFTVRGYRPQTVNEGPCAGEVYEEEFSETLYCDDLRKLGSWKDMAEQGLLVTGISVSSIVEGCDQDTDTIVLETDSLGGVKVHGAEALDEPEDDVGDKLRREFWKAVENVDQEANEIWMTTHGCNNCAVHWQSEGLEYEGEDGLTPVWKDCPACQGQGIII